MTTLTRSINIISGLIFALVITYYASPWLISVSKTILQSSLYNAFILNQAYVFCLHGLLFSSAFIIAL